MLVAFIQRRSGGGGGVEVGLSTMPGCLILNAGWPHQVYMMGISKKIYTHIRMNTNREREEKNILLLFIFMIHIGV
jgi:hypothetical protein